MRRDAHTFDSVLGIAARLFAEKGYDATSIQDIATAAGITKSSVYHHIRSKEELLETVCRRLLLNFLCAGKKPEREGSFVDKGYASRRAVSS